jgi:hypothetical protein
MVKLGETITHDGSMVLVYMLTLRGYIDGIHGTPYIAAPWIRHGLKLQENPRNFPNKSPVLLGVAAGGTCQHLALRRIVARRVGALLRAAELKKWSLQDVQAIRWADGDGISYGYPPVMSK